MQASPHKLQYDTPPFSRPSRWWWLARITIATPLTLWGIGGFFYGIIRFDVNRWASVLFILLGILSVTVAVLLMVLPVQRQPSPCNELRIPLGHTRPAAFNQNRCPIRSLLLYT